jgi:hypothetical protein
MSNKDDKLESNLPEESPFYLWSDTVRNNIRSRVEGFARDLMKILNLVISRMAGDSTTDAPPPEKNETPEEAPKEGE